MNYYLSSNKNVWNVKHFLTKSKRNMKTLEVAHSYIMTGHCFWWCSIKVLHKIWKFNQVAYENDDSKRTQCIKDSKTWEFQSFISWKQIFQKFSIPI